MNWCFLDAIMLQMGDCGKMDKAVMRGFIKGFDAAVGGAGTLSVSHLLFADNSLVSCDADSY